MPGHMGERSRVFALAVLLLGILLLSSCKDHQAEAPPPQTAEVAFVSVQPQRVTLTTELPGRTSAFLVAEIRPQVSGIIQKRLFTEGANVEVGQDLYQIDPAPFQAALDQATANLAVARKAADRARSAVKYALANVAQQEATLDLALTNRRRIESLAQKGAASLSDRDEAETGAKVGEATLNSVRAQVESNRQAVAEAEATIEQAQAALEMDQINLGYTRITAPIGGRIGLSLVTVGALVNANQAAALATIQQVDPIYVDVPQSTSELLRLKRRLENGQLQNDGASQNQVRLILEDDTVYDSSGTIQFRDISVDQGMGSVILRMVFPNPDGVLLPGMFVKAVVEEGVNEKAILVPQQAVSRDPKGNPQALVVDAADKVEQRNLSLEKAIGDQWLVTSGLATGDRVIVEGMQKARPGASVQAIPFESGEKRGEASPDQAPSKSQQSR